MKRKMGKSTLTARKTFLQMKNESTTEERQKKDAVSHFCQMEIKHQLFSFFTAPHTYAHTFPQLVRPLFVHFYCRHCSCRCYRFCWMLLQHSVFSKSVMLMMMLSWALPFLLPLLLLLSVTIT